MPPLKKCRPGGLTARIAHTKNRHWTGAWGYLKKCPKFSTPPGNRTRALSVVSWVCYRCTIELISIIFLLLRGFGLVPAPIGELLNSLPIFLLSYVLLWRIGPSFSFVHLLPEIKYYNSDIPSIPQCWASFLLAFGLVLAATVLLLFGGKRRTWHWIR